MSPKVVRRQLELGGKSVPLVEMTSADDGPLLTVVAGVHGCEYASMAGVRRWLRELEATEFRGRVRAVPVLNTSGFAERAPFVVPEDGKNLNRCFPGDPAGTAAERLAYDTYQQLILGSDAFIDAHCGDMVEALEPFAMYETGPAEEQARAMAVAYGLPFVLRQEPGPDRAVSGTTVGAAASAGIPAICAESGGCGLVQEQFVALHVAGLHNVLRQLDMTDGDPVPTPGQASLSRFIWPRCERAGWWSPAVGAGDRVAAGQTIGTVSSLDGSEVFETVTASADGVIIFVTSSPAVADDGLLLGLGAS